MPSHGTYWLAKSYNVLEMQIKDGDCVCVCCWPTNLFQPEVWMAEWKRFWLSMEKILAKYLGLLTFEHFSHVTYFSLPWFVLSLQQFH